MSIEQLMARIAELEETNARLKRKVARRKETRRSLLYDINNNAKAVELLSIDHNNGRLYKTKKSLYTNFQTFFTNILRVLNPAISRNYKTGNEFIRHYPITEVSANDYEVYKETIEACIDIIYENQKRLQHREPIAESISEEV